MKKFIVIAFIVVCLAVPTAAFAKAYDEISFGAGTSRLPNGQYSFIILGEEITDPEVFASSSYDVTIGWSRFWSSNDAAWLGLGFSVTIPVRSEQNAANQGGFDSPIMFSMDASLRFDIGPALSITCRLSGFGAIVHSTFEAGDLLGMGGSAGIGPTLYFSRSVGISCLIGGRIINATNPGLWPFASLTYVNTGWFATACLAIKV